MPNYQTAPDGRISLLYIGVPFTRQDTVGTTPAVMVVPPLGAEYTDYQSIQIINSSTAGQIMFVTEDGTTPTSTNGAAYNPGQAYVASSQAPYYPSRIGIRIAFSAAGGIANTTVR